MMSRGLGAMGAFRTAGRREIVAGRGFSMSTSARMGLKESSGQTATDYENHKQDSLNKQKQGAGQWKTELSSDSEEAVKAERGGESAEEVAKLQEQTKKAAEKAEKTGSTVRDKM